jgi:hypothetical protein
MGVVHLRLLRARLAHHRRLRQHGAIPPQAADEWLFASQGGSAGLSVPRPRLCDDGKLYCVSE